MSKLSLAAATVGQIGRMVLSGITRYRFTIRSKKAAADAVELGRIAARVEVRRGSSLSLKREHESPRERHRKIPLLRNSGGFTSANRFRHESKRYRTSQIHARDRALFP